MDSGRFISGVIATAGHTDHGKSALIARLTGTHPDRLKEERERGMTTDLGFASLLLPDGRRLGLLDVPGHSRFIRNMIAGVTAVQGLILVVAADDGVMPQTVEHLRVAESLGIQRGIVALSKADLVDDETLAMAREDVTSTLAGTFLAGCPIIPVSSVTGHGMAALEQALTALVERFPPTLGAGRVFRMAVQRVFQVHGFGTVATGIPFSGRVEAGSELEILDTGRKVRVKGVTAYHEKADASQGLHSLALNLARIGSSTLARGCVLAEPVGWESHKFMEARFHLTPDAPRALERVSRIHVHHGTRRVDGRLVLLDKVSLAPGETALVQMRLDQPLFAVQGDRFVVRCPSPSTTMGGGTILSLSNRRVLPKPQVLSELLGLEANLESEPEVVWALIDKAGQVGQTVPDLQKKTSLTHTRLTAILAELERDHRIVPRLNSSTHISCRALEDMARHAIALLQSHREKHPLHPGLAPVELAKRLDLDRATIATVLSHLSRQSRATIVDGQVNLPDAAPPVDEATRQLGTVLEVMLRKAGAQPVRLDQMDPALVEQGRTMEKALLALVRRGVVVRLGPGRFIHREGLDEADLTLLAMLERGGAIGAARFKESIGVSNADATALLEHFASVESLLSAKGRLYHRIP